MGECKLRAADFPAESGTKDPAARGNPCKSDAIGIAYGMNGPARDGPAVQTPQHRQIGGNGRAMGDSAEFEKLTMLEARLAAALDKIAAGIGARGTGAAVGMVDPPETSAAMEDALARADAAEADKAALAEQVTALEGRLQEATDALAEAEAAVEVGGPSGGSDMGDADIARLTEERDELEQRVQALEAARTADADETKRAMAERDEEITALHQQLQDVTNASADTSAPSSDAGAEDGSAAESLTDAINAMTVRLKRLQRQKQEALAERDDAKAVMDELGRSDDELDARILALRSEIVRLRLSNDDLLQTVDAVGKASALDIPDVIDALVSEIDALRTARASEAAEIARILADLEPAVAQGGAHA